MAEHPRPATEPPLAIPPHNAAVAARLRQAAELLEQQGANPFRVNAYRRGAETLERLPIGLAELVSREGQEGLLRLPGIGPGLAAAVREMLHTGRWSLLQRLRGAADPEALFRTLPGVGPELARRLHDHLDVESLEALEVAAHRGHLEEVPGVGPRRAAAIRLALGSMLGQRRLEPPVDEAQPWIDLLLAVDGEYRDRALADALPTITPHRFNPQGAAWLPVLHVTRGGWSFTALYSNTAQAHRLGKTRDWVVLYFYDPAHQEGQATVVTETRGPLAGRRVVRGRERECKAFYAGGAAATSGAAAAGWGIDSPRR
ncbi:MAG TPA: helix-hairpin-helix domain-containing protein [Thermoanaerobaculia bacterium]|nr:helix-hairpin-helix domain-containing protein [Thermoanaerobaculia bacterium]